MHSLNFFHIFEDDHNHTNSESGIAKVFNIQRQAGALLCQIQAWIASQLTLPTIQTFPVVFRIFKMMSSSSFK